jgi:choline dehydrogenase
MLAACSTHSYSGIHVHVISSDPAYFKHPLDVDLVGRTILHTLILTEVQPLKPVLRRDSNGEFKIPASSNGKLHKTPEEAREFAKGILLRSTIELRRTRCC